MNFHTSLAPKALFCNLRSLIPRPPKDLGLMILYHAIRVIFYFSLVFFQKKFLIFLMMKEFTLADRDKKDKR